MGEPERVVPLQCALCLCANSAVWMSSGLVLHFSRQTAHSRLEALSPGRPAHCCLCADCFSLLESWDQHLTAAERARQALLLRIDAQQPDRHDRVEQNRIWQDVRLTEATAVPCGETFFPDRYSGAAGEAAEDDGRTVVSAAGDAAAGPDADATEGAPLRATPPSRIVVECRLKSAAAEEGSVSVQTSLAVTASTDDADVTSSVVTCEAEPSAASTTPVNIPEDLPTAKSLSLTSRLACHICEKEFARRDSLQNHLAAHAGTRRYACTECGARFQYRDGLMVHRRRRHAAARLSCPHCTRTFEKSCNFKRHLRVHTGERPFVCGRCGRAFAQSNSLKKHARSVHQAQDEKAALP